MKFLTMSSIIFNDWVKIVLLAAFFAVGHAVRTLDNSFKSLRIVPDLLDEVPENSIKIEFPSGVEVDLGNELTPRRVKEKPEVVKWPTQEGKLYTLTMVDPDAPSRSAPIFRSYNHWTVVNIPGNNIEQGNEIKDFHRTAAPRCTGIHRYVFLVYEQTRKISPQKYVPRVNFDPNLFAGSENMTLTAANFYTAEWDSSLPGSFIPCFVHHRT